MQVSIESGEGLERRMTVTLPADQMEKEVEKRLKKIARTVRMDGFRPGKVPLSIVKQRYFGSVRQEVFGELIQSSFLDAVKQEDLKPAGEPKIEPVEPSDGSDLGYQAVFEVFPDVELADLVGVTIKRPIAEITGDDVSNMIEKLRKQRITWNTVDRSAVEGDQLKISFKGAIEGEAFEGGEASDVPLVLGSKRMVEGFEEGLVGATAGESRQLEVTFPDDYRVERLAGKRATFEVDVSEVAEPVMPEVDDEFAKSFGVAEGGIDALEKDIENNMHRELEQRTRAMLKQQVMDRLLERNKIEVPSALVDNEVSRMQDQARAEVASDPRAGSMELPRELFAEQASRRVALGLIISELVEKNGIEVDSDRVRATVDSFAAEYEDPEEVVRWYYGNREQLAKVESLVMEDQVVDWVLDQVSVEDDATTFDLLLESKQG